MKKRIAALLLCLMLLPLHGALADSKTEMTDNWYEIFVRSFYDSDGDRVGDLNGVTAKLDYLKDLGIGGIWLMPIHPSPSYHGYDVTDYYGVNPEFGTLEDFQALLTEAHARGIRVILDMVFNHTSNEHPWFQSARNDENSPYRNWYNWSETQKSGYNRGGSQYYESRFVASMPDLNLDNPEVRAEIENIMRYWLDMGVDGFRLDAVTSFYTNNAYRNKEFLGWLSETAKNIKPDCFMVGECWDSLYTIADYYQSGLDSFFLFPTAQRGGYPAQILLDAEQKGVSLFNTFGLLMRNLDGYLLSPILDNHDMDRIASGLGSANGATNIKMAFGLLCLMNGSVFVYYGDEIGMVGSGNDPNKRIGFFWDKKMNITRVPQGATAADYPFGSLESQMGNPLSIYNYYKAALTLRRDNPAIARGETILHSAQDQPQLFFMERIWGEDSVLIVVNLDIDDREITLPETSRPYTELAGEVEIWGSAVFDGETLTLP
ncbi:MAG: alpha amylase, partial [Clostridia bacterium]|nr:alpha amylase [Clostridia bacterium]